MGVKSRTKEERKNPAPMLDDQSGNRVSDIDLCVANVEAFFRAWKARDWHGMLAASTRSWRESDHNVLEWYEKMFGPVTLISYEKIEGTAWIHGAVCDVQIRGYLELPESRGKALLSCIVLVRSIKEDENGGPVDLLSPIGKWGVNPVSALRVSEPSREGIN